MAEYIKRESVVDIISEKQKELCPVGLYGRNHVYGSDREKYDNWEEIIDAVENIPAADVVPIVHARWMQDDCDDNCWVCSACGEIWDFLEGTPKQNNANYCPACGAKMKGEK